MRMNLFRHGMMIASAVALTQVSVTSASERLNDRLAVHEWGTFTVLQDESGRSLRGVNINEESLPDFVHRLAGGLTPDAHELGPLFAAGPYTSGLLRSKGIPRFYPAVTMRMETPIIYFHPSASAKAPLELDVEVLFRRGWISEWFPHGRNDAPGFKTRPADRSAGAIGPGTVGRITWEGLQVGALDGALPPATEHVWLAPRDVEAATVRNSDGEYEKFLFYRGVANLEAPLAVLRSADGHTLQLQPNRSACEELGINPSPDSRFLWLADIRPEGKVAFREFGPITGGAWSEDRPVEVQAGFKPEDYCTQNLAVLRGSMRAAVMESGLYGDEADALLNTWELSYFKSPGLRLFFLLPQAWTDAVLPLRLSVPADIERVMIGRIELVTPMQRELMDRIASGAPSNLNWISEPFSRLPASEQIVVRDELLAGRRSLADCGIEMPDNYRSYLALGRFRDALLVDESRRRSTPALRSFVKTYGLGYFETAASAAEDPEVGVALVGP